MMFYDTKSKFQRFTLYFPSSHINIWHHQVTSTISTRPSSVQIHLLHCARMSTPLYEAKVLSPPRTPVPFQWNLNLCKKSDIKFTFSLVYSQTLISSSGHKYISCTLKLVIPLGSPRNWLKVVGRENQPFLTWGRKITPNPTTRLSQFQATAPVPGHVPTMMVSLCVLSGQFSRHTPRARRNSTQNKVQTSSGAKGIRPKILCHLQSMFKISNP